MAENKVKQAVQEAIAEASNHNTKLQTIGTACAVAGTIGICLFFIIDAQVDKKTNDLRTELAVIKNQFVNQQRDIKETNENVKELTKHVLALLHSKKGN